MEWMPKGMVTCEDDDKPALIFVASNVVNNFLRDPSLECSLVTQFHSGHGTHVKRRLLCCIAMAECDGGTYQNERWFVASEIKNHSRLAPFR